MTRLIPTLVLIAAAAAAAIAANVALLRYGTASNDPVGKLRPVAHFRPHPDVVRPTTQGRSSTSAQTTRTVRTARTTPRATAERAG